MVAGITHYATVGSVGGGMWADSGISIPSRPKVHPTTYLMLRLRMMRPSLLRRRNNPILRRRNNPNKPSIIILETSRAFLTRRLRIARGPGNKLAMWGSACTNSGPPRHAQSRVSQNFPGSGVENKEAAHHCVGAASVDLK